MTPIELLLERLPDARRNGSGWSARCPSHEDQRPSLSVTEGDDGRALIHCHAGCRPEAIMAALGLKLADLMPPKPATKRNGRQAPRPAGPARGQRVFPSAAEAVAALERQHGRRSAYWTYRDAQGEPVGLVIRWDRSEGKDVRPVSKTPAGWVIGAMSEPRPLYNLPDLLARPGERVFVTEGEKCSDTLASLGLLSTTSAGGSQAADKTDWSPLAGRDVVILPDRDEAGMKYAIDVAGILSALSPPAVVRVLDLAEHAPGLPAGGDVADVIASEDWCGLPLGDPAGPADLAAMLERLAGETEPWRPEPAEAPGLAIEPWRPFPVDVLPEVLRSFVEEAAAALRCDPAFVAMPALATVGSAIGTSRAISLSPTWSELSIIWSVVVARSGTLKTPAFELATNPLWQAQIDALEEHNQALQEYEQAMIIYERELAKWKRSRDESEPPEKPQKPTARRLVTSDPTVEAVGIILESNPRGLLVARDELSGWVKSFDAYKPKGRGGDVAAWLELWRGGRLLVDRKGSGTICVPRAAASIAGTVQPGVLETVLRTEHFENGLAARLLMAAPPERLKRWNRPRPDRAVVDAYGRLIADLLALEHAPGEHGPEPVLLPLTDEAERAWGRWYDLHARRIFEAAADREAAALAKIEAYGARLGLIVALATDPTAECVGLEAITAGTTMADWFAHEGLRIYAMMEEPSEDRDRRRLVEWVERRGGSVTVRDVQMGCRWLREPGAAEAGLEELVKAGWGEWRDSPTTGRGGRPTCRFHLSTLSTVNETPEKTKKNIGSVDVDIVDTHETAAPEWTIEPHPVRGGLPDRPDLSEATDADWGEI